MNDDIIKRPTRTEGGIQETLFDMPDSWREHWWGMPAYSMEDTRPQYRITMNFMTAEDVTEFARKTGLWLSPRSTSAWFPAQDRLKGEYKWDGPKVDSIYPVCIPSKGRAHCQRTGRVLDELGVSYRFFVEETEYDLYCQHIGEEKVVKLPFHDLGQGSIPARNFIWEWAAEREYKRHWVVDDNIDMFGRLHNNRRLKCTSGAIFQAMENFVDRYENIHIAGPHHVGFIYDRPPNVKPITWNSRVYSCILIDTSLTKRWRGRYNEDTDLCIRVLKDGACTVLFNALHMKKGVTFGQKSGKPLPGGNTDNVYNTGDHRRAFAESLRDQHPDCVQVVWKFNRWHHSVDYSSFKHNKPIMRSNVTPIPIANEYGLKLVRTNTDESAAFNKYDVADVEDESEYIENIIDSVDDMQPMPEPIAGYPMYDQQSFL